MERKWKGFCPQAHEISLLARVFTVLAWSLVLDIIRTEKSFSECVSMSPLAYDPKSVHADKNLVLFVNYG